MEIEFNGDFSANIMPDNQSGQFYWTGRFPVYFHVKNVIHVIYLRVQTCSCIRRFWDRVTETCCERVTETYFESNRDLLWTGNGDLLWAGNRDFLSASNRDLLWMNNGDLLHAGDGDLPAGAVCRSVSSPPSGSDCCSACGRHIGGWRFPWRWQGRGPSTEPPTSISMTQPRLQSGAKKHAFKGHLMLIQVDAGLH